jgi:hypothetical protein
MYEPLESIHCCIMSLPVFTKVGQCSMSRSLSRLFIRK